MGAQRLLADAVGLRSKSILQESPLGDACAGQRSFLAAATGVWERRSQGSQSRLQVNLAFNLTLLWQFVGVLYTPAGSQSFASRLQHRAESLGPRQLEQKRGATRRNANVDLPSFSGDPEGHTVKAVKLRGCLKRLQLAKPRGHLPMLP